MWRFRNASMSRSSVSMSRMLGVVCHTVKCDLIDYPVDARLCDKLPMAGTDEMERVRAALKRAMERVGAKPKPLAIAAGLGETAVRDLLSPDSKDVKVSTLQKLAAQLHTTLEDLIGGELVPLRGRIGAGGSIVYDDIGVSEGVPRPPGLSGALEALEVQGDSMLPKFSEGDVVYIQRLHDGLHPSYFGEYCAVRLETGETYLKILARGSRPGHYTLRSLNAADIEDVKIVWATPIVMILPRFARLAIGSI